VNCEEIRKIEIIKYLGIIIYGHLKWDVHINNSIIKVQKLDCFYISARKALNKTNISNSTLWHGTVNTIIWDNSFGLFRDSSM